MTKRITPREFCKRGEEELRLALEALMALADELEWVDEVVDAASVGDSARTRSYGSRPTENIATHGYPEDEDTAHTAGRRVMSDLEARGKAGLRREREKAVTETLKAIIGVQNAVKERTSNLRKSMERLKPRGPLFEPPVRGGSDSTTVSKADMEFTRDAQRRRQERREDPPLICTCRTIDRGKYVEYVPTMMGRCAVHGEGATERRTA